MTFSSLMLSAAHQALKLGSRAAGVCVRLRETLETLFPDKIAARRVDVERQLAAERKRNASKRSQEGQHMGHRCLGSHAQLTIISHCCAAFAVAWQCMLMMVLCGSLAQSCTPSHPW